MEETKLRIEPPVLPLSREQFRRAIRTGHGRAMAHLLRHGAADIEDVLVEGAVWCPVYDPQTEDADARAGWIVDMVTRARLELSVLDAA